MKLLIVILCLFAHAGWAGTESEGESVEISPKPHQLQRFQYETTLLLDKATFSRRQLARLEIDKVIERSADRSGVIMAYRSTETREGLLVTLIVDGQAKDITRFFDSLLNLNLVSLVYGIGGFPWSTPSEEYKKYWGNIYRGINREIETQALLRWAASAPAGDTANLCELILEANRLNAPINSNLMLRTSRSSD